jgi:hypothetical protein
MSKQKSAQLQSPGGDDTQRLVVWGERRKEPDWDAYIAALLAYALRTVEDEGEPEVGS